MKKQLFKIGLTTFVALTGMNASHAQDVGLKRFTVGAGLNLDVYTGLGQQTKFEFNIAPKWSIGLRNNIRFWDKKNTQVNPVDGNGVQTTISWRETINNTACLLGSYSIIGSNQTDKKFQLNVFLGAGLNYYKYKWNYDNSNVPSNVGYTEKATDNSNIYFLNTGLGMSYKLGKGSLYVEIPFYFEIFNQFSSIYEDNMGQTFEFERTYKLGKKIGGWTYLDRTVGFQMGYQFNF
jgi:hypothetical protein